MNEDDKIEHKGFLRQYIKSLEIWHLNVAASIIVVLFVCWQFSSMFDMRNKKRRKSNVTNLKRNSTAKSEIEEKNAHKSKKDYVDREVGDEFDMVIENDGFHDESKSREIRYRGVEYSENEMQKRSQRFYEQMKIRRSVRLFSSKPVPLKLMQNLIKTAGTAPSGANLQPWTFCLVKSDVIKRGIREIVEYEEQLNYSRRMGAKWVLDVKHLNVNWNKPYLTEAPYVIVVMKHCYQLLKDGSRQPTYYNEISASIATGILLAAIQNAGLVTVTTTPLNAGSAIRELLQRPINEKVMLLLPIGYPAEDAHVPDIHRKPIENIIRIY